MTVDYEPDMPPPAPVAAAPQVRSRGLNDLVPRQEADAGAAEGKRKDDMEVAAERPADVQAAPFQAIFAVPGKVTILSTGEQKRVQIDEASLEPTLSVRTVPRVDPKAYLYAKLTLPKTSSSLLPGQVSLFRDGTFVGNGRLPLLAAGEGHDLGFGQDDSVRVRYAVVEEKKGEQGILTSSKTDQRNYRITVKNLHERTIGVSVFDQIPVSKNQDIKAEFVGKQHPTRRNIDDKTGVMAWDLKLEPQQEHVIEFGWSVQWPAAKRVQYGR